MNQQDKLVNIRSTKGFTLIELMLSTTFIALLMLAIASSVIYINSIYSKGLLMKSVNDSGRFLSDTIKRDISESRAFSVPSTAPRPTSPFVLANYINDTFGGRLCLGNVSYVWNYASNLKSPNRNLFQDESAGDRPIRLVRVDDRGALCADPDLPVDKTKAVEYLTGEDGLDVALYSVSVYSSSNQVDTISGQRIYNVDFVIGTSDGSMVRDNANPLIQKECIPPGESSGSSFNQCSINRFNLLARAANI